ncbi:MAG TPA: hypothetical protein DDY29_00415 [Rhodobacteraceae bacterium]|jgi:hypothetical protein|nr:MarR family transcriptional regulator [Paracoccaceae bacterium]HBG97239.1 hypothetical protein [Paracoccaceae bacterium]
MTLAVLTGDLIASQGLGRDGLAAALAALAAGAADIARWEGCAGTSFGRFRGDGWQLALPCPARALRAALVLRAGLRGAGKSFATRIAIATGPGRLPMGDINAESGPAYVASGRALDTLAAPATMILAGGGAAGAVVRLADHISAGWTQAQARAARRALPPGRRTQSDIADSLGISRQAARQALIAAGVPALASALDLIEGGGDA